MVYETQFVTTRDMPAGEIQVAAARAGGLSDQDGIDVMYRMHPENGYRPARWLSRDVPRSGFLSRGTTIDLRFIGQCSQEELKHIAEKVFLPAFD